MAYSGRGSAADYYAADLKAMDGSTTLAKLKTVRQTTEAKRAQALPDNESVAVSNVVHLRTGLKRNQVRESEGW